MLPLVVASVLNATYAGNAAANRAVMTSQTTETPKAICQEEIMHLWASANPETCTFREESGPAPAVGDTGCASSHGEGTIAWIVEPLCNNSTKWILVCGEDTWIFRGRNRRLSYFGSDWIVVHAATRSSSERDWHGSYNVVPLLNMFCLEDVPATFRNAGGLYICVQALARGQFVAVICNKNADPGRPACATDAIANSLNYDMVGSDDCPAPGIVG